MARSRRKQNTGGESKAPLIIALAFFMIATVALGVLAYNYAEDVDVQKTKVETATNEAKDERDKNVVLQDRLLLYKVFAGNATPAEIKSVQDSPHKEILYKDYEAIMKAYNDTFAGSMRTEAENFPSVMLTIKPADFFEWNWPANGKLEGAPKLPITTVLARMAFEREFGSSVAAAQIKKSEDSIKLADDARKAYEADRAKFPDQVKTLGDKYDVSTKALRQEVNDKKLEFQNAMDAYNKVKKEAHNEIEPLKKDIELLRLELAEARNALRELKKREGPTRTIQFDNPAGQITAAFPKSRIVEIDLGSSDQVRTGLTFTVYSPEARDRGSENKPPKAMIEVVEVVSPNLSRARITHFEDETRKPITKGDLLYNIGWKKGIGVHVVLFGIFDTDADGSDDIKNLVRDLAQMGIKVDGYFDLAARKWIGQPPGHLTDYAIVGYIPTINPGDSLAGPKGELITAINNAEGQAKAKDVTVIRAREFLEGIGYKVRNDITNEQINQAAAKYLILNAPAPENN